MFYVIVNVEWLILLLFGLFVLMLECLLVVICDWILIEVDMVGISWMFVVYLLVNGVLNVVDMELVVDSVDFLMGVFVVMLFGIYVDDNCSIVVNVVF